MSCQIKYTYNALPAFKVHCCAFPSGSQPGIFVPGIQVCRHKCKLLTVLFFCHGAISNWTWWVEGKYHYTPSPKIRKSHQDRLWWGFIWNIVKIKVLLEIQHKGYIDFSSAYCPACPLSCLSNAPLFWMISYAHYESVDTRQLTLLLTSELDHKEECLLYCLRHLTWLHLSLLFAHVFQFTLCKHRQRLRYVRNTPRSLILCSCWFMANISYMRTWLLLVATVKWHFTVENLFKKQNKNKLVPNQKPQYIIYY